MIKKQNSPGLPAGALTLFLGADPDKDSKVTPEQIKAVKEGASGVVTSINSMLDFLDEPLKAQFLKVKTDINAMLAGMPATDAVPAAQESNYVLRSLLGVMTMAQSMISSLSEAAKTYKGQLVVAQNSMSGEVDKIINAKIVEGLFLKKEDVQTKIDTAVTAARSGWETALKRVGDRKTLLTTASMPVPGDPVLTIEDKDFDPKKTTATERHDKLKVFKIDPAIMTQLCWDASKEEFDRMFTVLEATGQKATPGKPAEKRGGGSPFQTPAQAAGAVSLRKQVGAI